MELKDAIEGWIFRIELEDVTGGWNWRMELEWRMESKDGIEEGIEDGIERWN